MTDSRPEHCPRCSSTAVFEEKDIYGTFIYCIPCGWGKYADTAWNPPQNVTRDGFHSKDKRQL